VTLTPPPIPPKEALISQLWKHGSLEASVGMCVEVAVGARKAGRPESRRAAKATALEGVVRGASGTRHAPIHWRADHAAPPDLVSSEPICNDRSSATDDDFWERATRRDHFSELAAQPDGFRHDLFGRKRQRRRVSVPATPNAPSTRFASVISGELIEAFSIRRGRR
jgi:hypothetical protein